MPKETPKITKSSYSDEVLTCSEMELIIKDLKEFITAIVRGTENVLGDKIDKIIERLDANNARLSLVKEKIETHLTAHP